MPILPKEPCHYPDQLFAGPALEEEGRWWALHTKPRAEKTLARRLHASRIAFFLPVHQRRQLHRGRLRSSYLPLFPSYVFLRGQGEDRVRALESNLIVHCLEVADQQQLHEDLTRVHRLLESEAEVTPESRLRPGTPVEIIAGPFSGLQGKVERRGSRLRFIVEVRLLQQGVSLDIESWMIQPLDGPFTTPPREQPGVQR